MEIERKFLVNKIPENLENYEKIEIEQGYLTNKPTIRIRKANGKYILTIKSKFGVSKSDNGSIVNNEHELISLRRGFLVWYLRRLSFNHWKWQIILLNLIGWAGM